MSPYYVDSPHIGPVDSGAHQQHRGHRRSHHDEHRDQDFVHDRTVARAEDTSMDAIRTDAVPKVLPIEGPCMRCVNGPRQCRSPSEPMAVHSAAKDQQQSGRHRSPGGQARLPVMARSPRRAAGTSRARPSRRIRTARSAAPMSKYTVVLGAMPSTSIMSMPLM